MGLSLKINGAISYQWKPLLLLYSSSVSLLFLLFFLLLLLELLLQNTDEWICDIKITAVWNPWGPVNKQTNNKKKTFTCSRAPSMQTLDKHPNKLQDNRRTGTPLWPLWVSKTLLFISEIRQDSAKERVPKFSFWAWGGNHSRPAFERSVSMETANETPALVRLGDNEWKTLIWRCIIRDLRNTDAVFQPYGPWLD